MTFVAKMRGFHLLLGLFLLNFFSGLFFINEGIFHFDSIILAQAIEAFYQKGLLLATVNGRYGVFIINSVLYFPFYQIGHNAEFVICLSSILFHSVSIIALFLLIKELFTDSVQALFGALLFSFVPYYFIPNTYGKEHGMCMFFLLMSFYLVRRGQRKNSAALISLSSGFFIISITIRESALSVFPLFILFFFYPRIISNPFNISLAEGSTSKKALISFFLPLLIGLFAILTIYLWPILLATLTRRDTYIVSFLGLFSFILPIAIEHMSFALPLLLFTLFILGIYQILRNHDIFLGLFLFLWFMLLFYFGNTTGYTARHLDIITIPICIAASYTLRRISIKSPIIATSFLLYCILSMLLLMYPLLEFRHHYNGKKHFAYYLKSATENNAVIVTAEEGKFIEYYANRKTIWFPVESMRNSKTFVFETTNCLLHGVPVYYTNGGFSKEHETFSYEFMNKFFKLTLIGESINDDFNTPELSLNLYMQKLYKVSVRK